jgi:predicted RNA-binding Zn-ribbon protein involved in translation (DUF1610 family)
MYDARLLDGPLKSKRVTQGVKRPQRVKHVLNTCPMCGVERFTKDILAKAGIPYHCPSCSTKIVREKKNNYLMSTLTKNCKSCGKEFSVLKKTWIRGTKKCHSCRVRDSQKLGNGVGALNSTYSAYKSKAKIKKIAFKISKDIFKRIVASNCHYCGATPSNEMKSSYNTGSFFYNGIDRIDNNRGYTSDNIVPCCKICNYAKNTMSLSDFYSWISRVYKHINKE